MADDYPIDEDVSVSDGAKRALYWLRKLERQMTTRALSIARYERYYDGDHPLAFASEKFRSVFGGLFREFADNWCDLVVDSVEERLNVEGFRFGEETPDAEAWRIWQANALDAESQIAHTEALLCGVSYALVWPTADEGTPRITVEHPAETIVAYAAGNRRARLAALKMWLEDDGYWCATVYLPDFVWKFKSRSKTPTGIDRTSKLFGTLDKGWTMRQPASDPTWPLPNPFGVVPVVPFPNKPRSRIEGVSEIHKVIPVQDAVNKLVADMLVASEFQAFRQRYVVGWEEPKDPITGQPLAQDKAAVSRMWTFDDPNIKVGEFGQLDLGVFVKAIELFVQHVASQTRTPPHYFYLSGQFPSGESIKSAEAGLVSKARRRQRHFGEGWEEALRLAMMAAGMPAADDVTVETVWRDPEYRTEGEHVDALVKLRAIGVPDRQLQEDAGYSPTQIARFDAMLDEQAQRAAMIGLPLFGVDQAAEADGSTRPQPPA